jgi:tRNA-splicing endonuclease subunit Sen15
MGHPSQNSPITSSDNTIANPPASALLSFLTAHPPASDSIYSSAIHYLILQIAHNLRHQHNWHDIRLHTQPSSSLPATPQQPLSRPLLSGLPPRRVYTHPDEQIDILQAHKNQRKQESKESTSNTSAASLSPEPVAQREWVLPSHIREKWTLRHFGAAFDGISADPNPSEGEVLFPDDVVDEDEGEDGDDDDAAGESHNDDSAQTNVAERNRAEFVAIAERWRKDAPKRVLLATVHEDSTVVYYIIHDGIVKPRQN